MYDSRPYLTNLYIIKMSKSPSKRVIQNKIYLTFLEANILPIQSRVLASELQSLGIENIISIELLANEFLITTPKGEFKLKSVDVDYPFIYLSKA